MQQFNVTKFFINWDALARIILKNDFYVQITKDLKSIKESKETKSYLFVYLLYSFSDEL